jgi:hypothetical protein
MMRARRLADRHPVSFRDLIAMSAYFAGHAIDKNSKSHVWGDDENPSAGYIAWLLWGGDAGKDWADDMKARASRLPQG